jgi:uncharacterized protein YkvS
MNVPPDLAIMVDHAWIYLKVTGVTAQKDILVSNAKMNFRTALKSPVLNKQCAWTSQDLTTINAYADLDIKEITVI